MPKPQPLRSPAAGQCCRAPATEPQDELDRAFDEVASEVDLEARRYLRIVHSSLAGDVMAAGIILKIPVPDFRKIASVSAQEMHADAWIHVVECPLRLPRALGH